MKYIFNNTVKKVFLLTTSLLLIFSISLCSLNMSYAMGFSDINFSEAAKEAAKGAAKGAATGVAAGGAILGIAGLAGTIAVPFGGPVIQGIRLSAQKVIAPVIGGAAGGVMGAAVDFTKKIVEDIRK